MTIPQSHRPGLRFVRLWYGHWRLGSKMCLKKNEKNRSVRPWYGHWLTGSKTWLRSFKVLQVARAKPGFAVGGFYSHFQNPTTCLRNYHGDSRWDSMIKWIMVFRDPGRVLSSKTTNRVKKIEFLIVTYILQMRNRNLRKYIREDHILYSVAFDEYTTT